MRRLGHRRLASEYTAELSAPPESVWSALRSSGPDAPLTAASSADFEEGGDSSTESVFEITDSSPCVRFAFTLKNALLTGSYESVFTPLADGGTRIVFRDEVLFRSGFAWYIALFAPLLRRAQKLRVKKLRERLREVTAE